MVRSLFKIFLLFNLYSWGQPQIQTEDFNHDGFQDTMITQYSGGSGFGEREVKIINGKTYEQYSAVAGGCFCSIKGIVEYPKALLSKKNDPFLKALQKALIPPIQEKADPSLLWIINSSYNRKELDNHPYFYQIFKPSVNWTSEPYQVLSNYSIELSLDTLEYLSNYNDEASDTSNQYKPGALVYGTHNHYTKLLRDTSPKIIRNKTYTLKSTAHGVYAEKGNQFKWLFISDSDLVPTPEKLRWSSIGELKLFGKYAVIQQNLPPKRIQLMYVVNIETGSIGQIKYEVDDKNGLTIENDTISFQSIDEKVELNLNLIFEELDRL